MNREQIDQIVRRVYRRLLLDGKPDAAEGFRQTIIDASGTGRLATGTRGVSGIDKRRRNPGEYQRQEFRGINLQS
jgi:hypothetical protein